MERDLGSPQPRTQGHRQRVTDSTAQVAKPTKELDKASDEPRRHVRSRSQTHAPAHAEYPIEANEVSVVALIVTT